MCWGSQGLLKNCAFQCNRSVVVVDVVNKPTMKLCNTCGIEKDRSEFPSSGYHTQKDGTRTRLCKPDCKDCHNVRNKQQIEQMLSDLGVVWKCVRCGYDTCRASIDFHHINPADKDFVIASRWTISKQRLTEEVNKCIILCKNCHGEYHAGMWQLSELGC